MAHDEPEECLLESDGVLAAYLRIIKATPEQRTPLGFCHILLSLLPLPLIELPILILNVFGDFHAMRSSAEAARFVDPRVQCGMGLPSGEKSGSVGRKVHLASSLEVSESNVFLDIPRLVDLFTEVPLKIG